MDSTYQTDLALWAAQQAKALRDVAQAGGNAPVDWEHVAEEIESLGSEQRQALENLIGTIVEHLMKLQASPATDPRRGWKETIYRSRFAAAKRLRKNPSLQPCLGEMVESETADARELVRKSLTLYDEAPTCDLNGLSYSVDQVLEDWWPQS
jgi:hypothetical protein